MADYEYLTASGVIVPNTDDLLATVQAEWRQVFGQDLIVDSETPQGKMIAAEVVAREAFLRSNAALANQINPNVSGGVFLDALMALTGTDRAAAVRSVVTGVTLSGVAGAIIPSGAQAQTTAGDVFALSGAVTLDGTGHGVGVFQAVEAGPVDCPTGALSTIVTLVNGWETVNNSGTAQTTLGQLQAADYAARRARRLRLGTSASSTPEAVSAALAALPGYLSHEFRENDTGASATIDGVTIDAHSIWVCVYGASDAAVAGALLGAKGMGAGWSGSTTQAIVDSTSGQLYQVKFTRPTGIAVELRVTVGAGSTLADPAAAVRSAVLAWAAGQQDGEDGLVVGADVSPFEVAGAICRVLPGLYVKKVEVATVAAGVWQTDPIAIGLDQIATLAASAISTVIV